jgi:hypothetical protein
MRTYLQAIDRAKVANRGPIHCDTAHTVKNFRGASDRVANEFAGDRLPLPSPYCLGAQWLWLSTELPQVCVKLEATQIGEEIGRE